MLNLNLEIPFPWIYIHTFWWLIVASCWWLKWVMADTNLKWLAPSRLMSDWYLKSSTITSSWWLDAQPMIIYKVPIEKLIPYHAISNYVEINNICITFVSQKKKKKHLVLIMFGSNFSFPRILEGRLYLEITVNLNQLQPQSQILHYF